MYFPFVLILLTCKQIFPITYKKAKKSMELSLRWSDRSKKAYIKRNGKLIAVTLEEAYKFIANKLITLKGSEIAALSGDLSSVEEVFALKLLMEKYYQ